jgi:hypothetical protein
MDIRDQSIRRLFKTGRLTICAKAVTKLALENWIKFLDRYSPFIKRYSTLYGRWHPP